MTITLSPGSKAYEEPPLEPAAAKAVTWPVAFGTKGGPNRAIEIGTAAEMIVCADLILAGHRAFMTGAGLSYDLVLDVGGQLLRVGVKSTLWPRSRPAREGSRICYQFMASRAKRDKHGNTLARRYSGADLDMMAFVALDIRRVAYVPVTKQIVFGWHFDAPGQYAGTNKYGPKNGGQRRQFDDFPLSVALAKLGVLE
jgi:hypothetical protein